MPRKPPKYMLHRPSGQARIRIGGRDFYLGPFDSPESHKEYDALLAKYLTGNLTPFPTGITISRLAVNFVGFARGYYLKDGEQTAEVHRIQMALKPLVRIFGTEKINSFGPLKLKAIREEMIRLNWARKTINKAVERITRMLRWGTENECVDPSVYQACRAVTGLRRGRCTARDTAPIQPVSQHDIDVECGEERFLVEWDQNNDCVWYDILAFSRPHHVLARLGYPVVRRLQKKFARDSAAVMQRDVTRAASITARKTQ